MVYSQEERNRAFARAMKFQRLFRAPHFTAIVDAIQIANPGDRRNAFNTAVAGIMWLTAEEKDWLYNYLKECGSLWSNDNVLEAAAGTGW